MIALQHVEAAGEPRLRRLEDRKVMQVLDLMVGIELLQEELQPGRKPGAEVRGRRGPVAKCGGRLLQRCGNIAEHVMAREPELRHGAEIVVSLPHRARVAVDQEPQIGRPAVAGVERERRGRGFVQGLPCGLDSLQAARDKPRPARRGLPAIDANRKLPMRAGGRQRRRRRR